MPSRGSVNRPGGASERGHAVDLRDVGCGGSSPTPSVKLKDSDITATERTNIIVVDRSHNRKPACHRQSACVWQPCGPIVRVTLDGYPYAVTRGSVRAAAARRP